MKPKLKQIVIWGEHTDEIGIVSRIGKDGFWARYRSSHPSVPGGLRHPEKSRYFTFAQLGKDVRAA